MHVAEEQDVSAPRGCAAAASGDSLSDRSGAGAAPAQVRQDVPWKPTGDTPAWPPPGFGAAGRPRLGLGRLRCDLVTRRFPACLCLHVASLLHALLLGRRRLPWAFHRHPSYFQLRAHSEVLGLGLAYVFLGDTVKHPITVIFLLIEKQW